MGLRVGFGPQSGASGIADLASLSLSAGALSPGFTPDQTSYRIATGNSTTQTTITAVLADATATLTVNGTPATSGQPFGPIGLTIGANILTVRVTAQDGSAKVYTIEISRPPSSNANLSALVLSAGSFSPAWVSAQWWGAEGLIEASRSSPRAAPKAVS